MKKILYILILLLWISCRNIPKWENVSIYKRERVGEIAPSYLIVKGGALNQCDLIFPQLGFGISGNYIIKQDSLIFHSKYDYYPNYIYTTDSIPYVFLIKNKFLIHIMNDSIWGIHEEIYKKMK